jgi:hypothetical protein
LPFSGVMAATQESLPQVVRSALRVADRSRSEQPYRPDEWVVGQFEL